MASPKLKETGKRIIGQNILTGCKLRQKQMQYILDNLSEPDFSLIECPKQIADEFNMDDREVLNGAGITWRILNTQGFGNGQHNSSTPPSYGSVANFMRDIQCYLPKSLQSRRPAEKLWSHYSFQVNDTQKFAEKTKELLDQMVEWLIVMRQKIEDYITARYYRDGRINHLEILKRRYKDDWSEKIEQSVDADVKEDKNVEIIFEDVDAN